MRTHQAHQFGAWIGRWHLAAVAVMFVMGVVQGGADKARLEASARELVSNLAAKNYGAAISNFDKTMSELMPEPKMAEVWRLLQYRHGAFKSAGAARHERVENYDIIFIATEFDRTNLDAKIVFDEEGKVAGLFFVPATQGEETEPEPEADAPGEGRWREEDFILESGAFKLPGVLTLPLDVQSPPVALLVAGSGPNDRDSTIGPNKPLRDLAHGLAWRGVASLRYDKRTKVYGQSLDVKTLTYQEEVVDDALAAIRALRRDERVNGRRIYLVGHSLGGHLAPEIARQARTSYLGQERIEIGGGRSDSFPLPSSIPLPGALPFASSSLLSGVVILAGNTRKMVPMIMDQFTHIALEDGTITPQERSSIMSFKAGADALLKHGEAGGKPVMGLTKTYLEALNAYDPLETMRGVALPFMILQGGRDYQVLPRQDFEAWRSALGDRKDGSFKLYPDLNHLFIAGEGTSYPAEYMTPGRVSDEVIEDIALWIRKQGK